MVKSKYNYFILVLLAMSLISEASAEEFTTAKLFDAVNVGHVEVVQEYLDSGGESNQIVERGVFRGTLLHAALWRRQDDISVLLIKSGADISLGLQGAHALDFAAQGGIYKTASLILELYPDSLQNSDAIVLAGDEGFYDLVELFLKHKPSPYTTSKKQIDQALFAAVVRGYEDVARLLLNHGATPSAAVLISASWGSSPSIVRELLHRGASPNETIEDQTALDSVIRRIERYGPTHSSRNILWELAQAGADVCLLSNAKNDLKIATLNEMLKVSDECSWISEEIEMRHEQEITQSKKLPSYKEGP